MKPPVNTKTYTRESEQLTVVARIIRQAPAAATRARGSGEKKRATPPGGAVRCQRTGPIARRGSER